MKIKIKQISKYTLHPIPYLMSFSESESESESETELESNLHADLDSSSESNEDWTIEFNYLRRSRYRFAIKPVQIINKKNKYKSQDKVHVQVEDQYQDQYQDQECFDCSICLNDKLPEDEKVQIKECKHSFCGSCIIDCLDKLQIEEELKEFNCPLCRKQVKTFNVKEPELCNTLKIRFCKYQKETKRIYYGEDEDSWINYLLSCVLFLSE